MLFVGDMSILFYTMSDVQDRAGIIGFHGGKKGMTVVKWRILMRINRDFEWDLV